MYNQMFDMGQFIFSLNKFMESNINIYGFKDMYYKNPNILFLLVSGRIKAVCLTKLKFAFLLDVPVIQVVGVDQHVWRSRSACFRVNVGH